MDLSSVESVDRPASRAELPAWGPGMALVAGGTWLFSEPQPELRRLVDLGGMGWAPIAATAEGLTIAATCPIAVLEAFEPPPDWTGATAIPACCNALLGSFKVWNTATVGGNVCLALPAAPMLALAVAMEGVAQVWRPDGTEHLVAMARFATGAQRTVLAPGEVLRAILLPAAALRRRAAVRQASLTPLGRSAALLVATRGADGFALTITASLVRPIRACWAEVPDAATLAAHVAAIPAELWHDDVHGSPAWRRHMTGRLAIELREALA